MRVPPIRVEVLDDPENVKGVAQRIADSLVRSSWKGNIEMVTLLGSFLNQCGAEFHKKAEGVKKGGEYKAWFDGSSKGNPGPAQIGYVIINDEGETVSRRAEPIGTETNNAAEYKALRELVATLKTLGVQSVHIQGDSKLVVEQINGNWKVRNEKLKLIYDEIKRDLACIPNCTIEWVPREKNSMADRLAQHGR